MHYKHEDIERYITEIKDVEPFITILLTVPVLSLQVIFVSGVIIK